LPFQSWYCPTIEHHVVVHCVPHEDLEYTTMIGDASHQNQATEKEQTGDTVLPTAG